MVLLDPTKATVDILDKVVVKTHKDRDRFTSELVGYSHNYWASPELVSVDVARMELVIEKCTPMTQVKKDRDHAIQARQLLERIHQNGWNHRDCSVLNMVLHETRGVLLIDWETAYIVPDPVCVSYDLYGALAADCPQELVQEHQRPHGVWWGSGRELDPGTWWRDVLQ